MDKLLLGGILLIVAGVAVFLLYPDDNGYCALTDITGYDPSRGTNTGTANREYLVYHLENAAPLALLLIALGVIVLVLHKRGTI